jgi:selenoprotein W-related protein
VSTVKDLLSNYQHIIEELRLVTGSKGVFDVVVDGNVLYSKHAEGRHAEPGEVLARFVEAYGEGISRYGE